jgi:predicted transcriptional regulator of viral defense system
MSQAVRIVHEVHAKTGPVDRRVAALAARQHGVVARRQLLEIGLQRGAIAERLRVGNLHRIHRGVYAVGYPVLGGHGRVLAGVLACGPYALLACRSATWLWALGPPPTSIEVLVEGRAPDGASGVLVRRTRSLHPEDRAVRDGIPVTSVARTLLDLAAVAHPDTLERAIEKADNGKLFDRRAVDRALERAGNRKGTKRLRRALGEVDDVRPLTRSDVERLFLALCRRADLPPPAHNLWVEGQEVDALWADKRLVVEVDGYDAHRTRAAFERDRRRDAALQVAGYRVLRVTDRRLKREPEAVADEVRSLMLL